MAVKKGAALTGIAYLQWAREQALATYEDARRAGSFVAAEKSLRTATDLAVRIALEEEKARAAGEMDPSQISEEKFADVLRDRVRQLAVPHLEIAVEEYLRRHPGLEIHQP